MSSPTFDIKRNESMSSFLLPISLSKVPFKVERIFVVSSNSMYETRGEHAHKLCRQIIVCIRGAINIHEEDFRGNKTIVRIGQGESYILEPEKWAKQEYCQCAEALVLCDSEYAEDDYIREYEEFRGSKTC